MAKEIKTELGKIQIETKKGKENLNVVSSDAISNPIYKKWDWSIVSDTKWFIWRYVNWKDAWIWLEFKVAEIENDPILKQVRDADNLDMTWNRLVGEQWEAAFMDMIYSIWSNTKNSQIIGLLEKYEKTTELDKKIEIKNKLISLYSETEVYKLNKSSVVVDQKKQFNIDRNIESNLSVDKFKLLVLENLKQFDYSGEWEQSWAVMENVILNEKVNWFSMRHVGWLFAVDNCVDVWWKYEITINDENYVTMYNDPSFNVEEDWVTINMALYHTWRLYSAIQHNTRWWKTPVIEIKTKEWNIIASTKEWSTSFELFDINGNIYSMAISK